MNLLQNATWRHKTMTRIGGVSVSLALVASSFVGLAATAQADAQTSASDILLGVGATESQRIISWYYPTDVPQGIEIEKTSELTANSFNGNKLASTSVTQSANTTADVSASNYPARAVGGLSAQKQKGYPGANSDGSATGATPQVGYINAHAIVNGLQPATSYSYHVGPADGSNWSTTYSFTTGSTSNDFNFMFFGDPQIGSSGGPILDGQGWAKTLEYAVTRDPSTELLVSGGDQIEHANSEVEWSAFADSSSVLKQYPWASTIGNHDVGGKAYEQHNKVPNVLQTPDFYPGGNKTTNSGGDYWFLYKNVLFVDINSNAYTAGSDPEHVSFVRAAVNAVGAKAKWKVLVYHHSIYSPADHANDLDNQQRRVDFTTAFSDMGINLVLQGHDHSYTRSYAILNGAKANPAEQPAAPEVFSGPGGVIYVTANSASGSKYYDLTQPDSDQGGYGPDPLDTPEAGNTGDTLRHWANSVEDQEHVRTYVKVAVTSKALDVKTIRSGDCSADESANPNAAVQRGNVSTCGGLTGSNPTIAFPAPAGSVIPAVGTFVDQFKLDAAVPATTTTISASRTRKVYGTAASVVLTAKVTGGIGARTGKIGFYEGSRLLAVKSVSQGQAAYTLPTTLGVGRRAFTARYTSGSSFFAGNSVTARSAVVTVVKASTRSSVRYASGKVLISITANSPVNVTGRVRVFDGKTLVKTVSVSHGKTTSTLRLKKGTHRLRVVYLGTANIAGSTSATVTVRTAR